MSCPDAEFQASFINFQLSYVLTADKLYKLFNFF